MPGSSTALTPSQVAGAPSYAVPDFNVTGQVSNGPIYSNVLNSLGQTVTNLGLSFQIVGAGDTWSLQSLTGTAAELFGNTVSTQYNTAIAITISNIPYAYYDVVVYNLPDGLISGTQTSSVTVGDGAYNSGTVQQTLTKLPTGYTVAKVPFATNSSVTDDDTIVFQGLTSSIMELQGKNIAGFQIVERPYDQGVPTSYNIQRATGTSGTFTTVGTVSGTTLSYTDTSVSAGTAYQYRVQAVNSYGTSGNSNSLSVTTPASTTGTSTAPVSNFASWQSQYFTAAQLADPTISGPTADPYGSTVPNLLAYALQLNPSTATPADVPSPVITNGHLAITYFVPTAITDINYIVEVFVESDHVEYRHRLYAGDVERHHFNRAIRSPFRTRCPRPPRSTS